MNYLQKYLNFLGLENQILHREMGVLNVILKEDKAQLGL